MFKPRLRITQRIGLARPSLRSPPFVQRRSIHQVPALVEGGNEIFQTRGIEGFLSAEAFDMGYTQYQTLLLENLNRLTRQTHWEELSVLNTAIATAREPNLATIFNHASMAHNSHFFFQGVVKGEGCHHPEMTTLLQEQLTLSFSSIDTLKREMLLTANAMFGPGFVWLVKLKQANTGSQHQFRVLTTYLAGSPHPGAHWRRQGTDMNTVGVNDETLGETVKEFFDKGNVANGMNPIHGSQAHAGPGQGWNKSLPGGVDTIPLLCVSTWEHVWLRDFGLGAYGYGGKMAYLEAWWDAINWGRVQELAELGGREFQ